MFFVVESQKLVNSVVVNVEKERKKGCWKVSKTSQILARYHVLEAGEDREKQRKYRVVEVEKVKNSVNLVEKNVSLWWKVVAVRFPATGPSAEGCQVMRGNLIL